MRCLGWAYVGGWDGGGGEVVVGMVHFQDRQVWQNVLYLPSEKVFTLIEQVLEQTVFQNFQVFGAQTSNSGAMKAA